MTHFNRDGSIKYMNNRYGISQVARLFFIVCLLFAEDGLVEARGGRGGGGRGGGGGSRGSSSGRGSSSNRGSSSSSKSSSSYGSSYRSSGTSYSSYDSRPLHVPSRKNWFDRYSGNTIVVMRPHTYYGSGSSVYTSRESESPIYGANNTIAMESERPLVTSEMIRNVLFPSQMVRKPSREIFDYEENPYRQRHVESDSVVHNFQTWSTRDYFRMADEPIRFLIKEEKSEEERKKERLMRDSEKDEQVFIRDDRKAVIVGSMAYFFGDQNLPRTDVSTHNARELDTVTFKAANNDSTITVYGVAALTRCSKSLDEVVTLGRRKNYGVTNRDVSDIEKAIIHDKHGIVKELAWFCPQSIKCCEWECCSTVEKPHQELDPPDEDFVRSVHIAAVLLLILTSILVCACCFNMDENEETAEATGDREPSFEMHPIVTDYPKQARCNSEFTPIREYETSETNEGTNVGWAVKPTAPSASLDSVD